MNDVVSVSRGLLEVNNSIFSSKTEMEIFVYKDEDCSSLIKQFHEVLWVCEEEDDDPFEHPMWLRVLENIEEEFPDQWKAALFYRSGFGRVFYRQKHLLEDDEFKPNISAIPRIFYFDVENIEHLERSYSNALVYTINRSVLDEPSAYIFGRDGYIWRLAEEFHLLEYNGYKSAVVVMVRSEASDIWYSLAESHKALLKIQGGGAVKRLAELVQSQRLLQRMLSTTSDCRHAAKVYGLDMQLLDKIHHSLIKQSDTLVSEFKADYC